MDDGLYGLFFQKVSFSRSHPPSSYSRRKTEHVQGLLEDTVPEETYLCSASIGESHPGPWKVLRTSSSLWWYKTSENLLRECGAKLVLGFDCDGVIVCVCVCGGGRLLPQEVLHFFPLTIVYGHLFWSATMSENGILFFLGGGWL